MSSEWDGWVSRWTGGGLLDEATAERIRQFEAAQDAHGAGRLRWPILIALGFGALMVGGGVLLFVAANWDALSPASRFALVLVLVSIFHVAGALGADRFPAMSQTLHAVGTSALGGGIALSGQIFNLDEHWPGGILLWAVGAAAGWLVLRHTAQLALVAILTPAWLVAEWIAATNGISTVRSGQAPAAGVLLLSLAYLSASGRGVYSRHRRALVWIGVPVLAVGAPFLAVTASNDWPYDMTAVSSGVWTIGWTAAFAGPILLAALLRKMDAWPMAIAAAWVAALVFVPSLGRDIPAFAWWGIGAIGLTAWGVSDGRVERINLGAIVFAATVLFFYFSRVMDKLGRSASLLVLGLLFLGGGWALERMRRQLVAQSRERQ